jgi:glutathione S-transferase
MNNNPPILYSLQNCPYAIRARFTLFKAKQKVLIRAVKLNNKPPEMIIASPKGSVPILLLNALDSSENNKVFEESLDIMEWALTQNDPNDLLHKKDVNAKNEIIKRIKDFEIAFIPALEAYCCAKRYHETNLNECRAECEKTLRILENYLTKHSFLYSNRESFLDIAVFPFIRKFARVERQWYRNSPYPKLRQWLANYLQSSIFTKVMANHELWIENKKDILFGEI